MDCFTFRHNYLYVSISLHCPLVRFLAMSAFVANILPAALVGTSLGQQAGRTMASLHRYEFKSGRAAS